MQLKKVELEKTVKLLTWCGGLSRSHGNILGL